MATSFSYAQAAKGQAPATTSAIQSTENVKDSASSANGEQPTAEPKAVKTASAEEETSRNTNIRAQLAAKQDSSAPVEANATNNTSAAASVADSRRDDEDAATEASVRRSEKSVRSASASTRVTDEAEPKKGSRKPRKGKAGKESSDESKKDNAAEQEKEQPKIELVEAPLPSVNIWMQRKETQAAKTTITLPTHPAPAAPAASAASAAEAWPNSQESKKKNKTAEASEATNGAVNGTKPQRKVGDETGARRNGSRGSRLIERDNRSTELPPPVNDVTSWPTPETAVKEAVKEETRKPAEKTERSEAEAQEDSGKGKAKFWKPLDFVPTVTFSTPIPSTRGARGGRGGGRGGRDATSRGGHGSAAAAADKSAAPPSKTGGEARERARDGNAPARTDSQLPAANKRASMDGTKEQRKPSAPSGERTKESQSTTEQAGPARGEGRNDRGRGNFRGGRGSHPGNASMHAQQSSFMANGNSFGSQGPPRQYSSPPLHQSGNFNSSYGGSQPRGGRGGRGQSNGSGAYRGVGGSSAGRARQIQTHMGQASWDYSMPMTPATYGWYDQIRQILIPQLEYYFSIENLLKDEFLRKHMDGQGFVPLDLVLGFSRVRDTADPTTLRAITAECTQLEYVIGDDSVERVRSRAHWQKFVYPAMEQRAESARNAGPQFFWPRSLHAMAQYNGMMGEYPVTSPNGLPNGGENGYMHYPQEAAAGQPNGQLSAQVPEFQPNNSAEGSADADAETKTQPLVNGAAEAQASAPLTNGKHAQTTEPLQS